MEKSIYEAMTKALSTAQEKLGQASYLSECGSNPGLRQMNSNKAEWLKWVVYLAEKGLEAEMHNAEPAEEDTSMCEACPVAAEAIKLTKVKDTIISEFTIKTDDLDNKLKALQLLYDYEFERSKACVEKAKIKITKDISNFAHDHCWLDGADLVCSVEQLDEHLTELIKE